IPMNVPTKNSDMAPIISVRVLNRSTKKAVMGINTAAVNIKVVVNHCTCVELLANSFIISQKAVINKNGDRTDKNAADSVMATIKRLCKSERSVLMVDTPLLTIQFFTP